MLIKISIILLAVDGLFVKFSYPYDNFKMFSFDIHKYIRAFLVGSVRVFCIDLLS